MTCPEDPLSFVEGQSRRERYCGRDFSEAELTLIRTLIAEDPRRTRADLSRLACQAMHWLKPDGGLKDMSCRVAMLRMQDDGLIQLPPPRCPRPQANTLIRVETGPQEPMLMAVHDLPRLQLRQAGDRADSRLWNEYIQRYHYLGFKTLPRCATALLDLCRGSLGRTVGLWRRRLAVRAVRSIHRLDA